MAKNVPLSLVVVLVLIFLGIGFFLGFTILKPGCPPAVPCPLCYLDSKLASSWVGYATGELKEISGKDLTMVSGNENLKITLLDSAIIQTMEGGKLTEAKLENIKSGDKLEIQFVYSNKQILGSMVTILTAQ